MTNRASALWDDYLGDFDARESDVLVPMALLIGTVLLMRPVLRIDFLLGYDAIASTILVWMVVVAGYNLLLGYTGLLSFGHSMFLGSGMYVAAITLYHVPASRSVYPLVAIGAVILTGLIGYVIGRMIVGKGNIYFAMLTIAFAQVFFYLVNINPGGLTRGRSGISSGLLPPWVETFRGEMRFAISVVEFDFYWIFATMFVVTIFTLFRIVRSPFGRSLIGIRENEQLAESIGIHTTRYKLHAFTISAVITGIGGVMLKLVNQSAGLMTLHWTTSGDIVIMAILGGMSSFIGPMVGVLVWVGGSQYLIALDTIAVPLYGTVYVGGYLRYWRLPLGILFVLIVLFSPEGGIWGFIRRGARKVFKAGRTRVRARGGE